MSIGIVESSSQFICGLQGDISVYIHWPYCLSKCPYCDFNSHVARNINHHEWCAAYLSQIKKYEDLLSSRRVKTLFFGGGTPSLMEPFVVESIIKALNVDSSAEITLEANPTSVEIQKLRTFKTAGVNRISMGIQALNNEDLKFLGRTHSVEEALAALDTACRLFDNVSFDLIYARPHQTLKAWEAELKNALSFGTKHLSLYQLTIEENTPFYAQYRRGAFALPKDDVSYAMYIITRRTAQDYGLEHYEISNYARPGFESQHNLTYWTYQDYLGLGPGAHSRLTLDLKKWAIEQIKSPKIWLKDALEKKESVNDPWIEQMMMGLRLRKGFKPNFELNDKIQNLIQLNLLKFDQGYLSATEDGFLKLNGIMEYLL